MAVEPRFPPAPTHLGAESKRFWRQIVREFALEAHHLTVLLVALEALDRMRQAQAAIEADGPYLADRFGQLKAHPALGVERDSRVAMLRALRELGLDYEPVSGGQRTQAARDARWQR